MRRPRRNETASASDANRRRRSTPTSSTYGTTKSSPKRKTPRLRVRRKSAPPQPSPRRARPPQARPHRAELAAGVGEGGGQVGANSPHVARQAVGRLGRTPFAQ